MEQTGAWRSLIGALVSVIAAGCGSSIPTHFQKTAPIHAKISITPASPCIGDTIKIQAEENLAFQGPVAEIWFNTPASFGLPTFDSVLLYRGPFTNGMLTYQFELKQEIGPRQDGKMLALVPGTYQMQFTGAGRNGGSLTIRSCPWGCAACGPNFCQQAGDAPWTGRATAKRLCHFI